jgi:hypothetical protein
MEITGTANMQGSVVNGSATGAFAVTSRGYHGSGSSKATTYINDVNFYASRKWTGATSENGGTDARPSNFTKKLWVRTA